MWREFCISNLWKAHIIYFIKNNVIHEPGLPDGLVPKSGGYISCNHLVKSPLKMFEREARWERKVIGQTFWLSHSNYLTVSLNFLQMSDKSKAKIFSTKRSLHCFFFALLWLQTCHPVVIKKLRKQNPVHSNLLYFVLVFFCGFSRQQTLPAFITTIKKIIGCRILNTACLKKLRIEAQQDGCVRFLNWNLSDPAAFHG